MNVGLLDKIRKTAKGVKFDAERKLDQMEKTRNQRKELQLKRKKEKRTKLLKQKKERLEEIKLDRQIASEEAKIKKLRGKDQGMPGMFSDSGEVPSLFGGDKKKKRKDTFRI